MHVIGDIIQSIGVIIASTVIYFYPEAKVADPICTLLFSVLVLFTTIPVFGDCMRILMQSVPKGINTRSLIENLLEIEGVNAVDDIHVWSIASGKNVLTAYLALHPEHRDKAPKVYKEAKKKLAKYEICHVTL